MWNHPPGSTWDHDNMRRCNAVLKKRAPPSSEMTESSSPLYSKSWRSACLLRSSSITLFCSARSHLSMAGNQPLLSGFYGIKVQPTTTETLEPPRRIARLFQWQASLCLRAAAQQRVPRSQNLLLRGKFGSDQKWREY